MGPDDVMSDHVDTVFNHDGSIIVRLNDGDPRFTIDGELVNEQLGCPIHIVKNQIHGIVSGIKPRYSAIVWYVHSDEI